MNTYHIHRTAGFPWSGADISSIDTSLKKLYSTNVYAGGATIKAFMKTTGSWTDTVYTPLDGTSASTTITAGIPGTSVGDSLPSEVSAVVTLRTAKRGRSYRGRIYLPPFIVNQADTNGNIIASAVTQVTSQFTGWIADLIATQPGVLCVASYLHATMDLVTTATVDNKFDVQRRRK